MGSYKNYRLVQKYAEGNPNCLNIWFVLPTGQGHLIATIIFPSDQQYGDNHICADEICTALKKRIRKSF